MLLVSCSSAKLIFGSIRFFFLEYAKIENVIPITVAILVSSLPRMEGVREASLFRLVYGARIGFESVSVTIVTAILQGILAKSFKLNDLTVSANTFVYYEFASANASVLRKIYSFDLISV